jgi:carbon monoxide dehydrogenase subunit G
MKLSGAFTTQASPAQLAKFSTDRQQLEGVTSLRDVSVDSHGRIRATLTATTPLGAIPLTITITTERADESSSRVLVHGTRGQHRVDVTLEISYEPTATATRVSWHADVRLGGTGASVAQRVAHDIARHAIESVLRQATEQHLTLT